MRFILLILFVLPLSVTAQRADSLSVHHKRAQHKKPEGFAEIGYSSEQWILTSNLPGGYSGVTYGGKGIFLGGGFRSRIDDTRPLGFVLSGDFLNYTMNKSLKTNELVQTGYNFARISPGAILAFRTKGRFSFHTSATISVLVPLASKENSYYQFGIRGILGYKAYGLILGYSFSRAGDTPASEISTGTWRESSVSIGAICYPGRLIKKKKS